MPRRQPTRASAAAASVDNGAAKTAPGSRSAGTRPSQPRIRGSRRRDSRKPHGPARRLLCIASALLTVLGTMVFAAIAIAPDTVQWATGNAKVATTKWASNLFQPDAIPEIVLGTEGGKRELDECDGRFTEMVSYRSAGILPLYAAHNVCGGDVILGWDIGQRVRVRGSDTVYVVVEERHTPQGTSGDLLRGMAGEFMLQTCFYGENRMRFLSLSPLTEETSQP